MAMILVLPAVQTLAQDFIIEAPSTQGSDEELASPDFMFEGGVTPIQANGKNTDFILVPIAVKPCSGGISSCGSAASSAQTSPGASAGSGQESGGGNGGGTGPTPGLGGTHASSSFTGVGASEPGASSVQRRSRAAAYSAASDDVRPAAGDASSAAVMMSAMPASRQYSAQSSGMMPNGQGPDAGAVNSSAGDLPEDPDGSTEHSPASTAAAAASTSASMLLMTLAEAAIGARLKAMYAFEAVYEALPSMALS